MSFQKDKTAQVTFVGDHYTISTIVDVPADDLDQEMEPIIVANALAFLKDYYGWDLDNTWFEYDIKLENADGSHLGE